MEDLISVIVPVYNGEKFIEQCIKSICNQSWNALQIIIVDDGSTDGTRSVLKKYCTIDPRIVTLQQTNSGVSAARNAGLSIVKGKWILFVDADDYIEKDYCENMVNAARNAKVDVLIAQQSEDDKSKTTIVQDVNKLIQSCLSFDENMYPLNIDAPWGKIFDANIIFQNGIAFPLKLKRSEDAYFCMSYYEHTRKVGVYSKLGYIHVEREGSLCRSFDKDALRGLTNILSENEKWIDTYHPNEFDRDLWYRVLPGIVECENSFFFHSDNQQSFFSNLKEYSRFLSCGICGKAIRRLKVKEVTSKQYKLRLVMYKFHLAWLFYIMKSFLYKDD